MCKFIVAKMSRLNYSFRVERNRYPATDKFVVRLNNQVIHKYELNDYEQRKLIKNPTIIRAVDKNDNPVFSKIQLGRGQFRSLLRQGLVVIKSDGELALPEEERRYAVRFYFQFNYLNELTETVMPGSASKVVFLPQNTQPDHVQWSIFEDLKEAKAWGKYDFVIENVIEGSVEVSWRRVNRYTSTDGIVMYHALEKQIRYKMTANIIVPEEAQDPTKSVCVFTAIFTALKEADHFRSETLTYDEFKHELGMFAPDMKVTPSDIFRWINYRVNNGKDNISVHFFDPVMKCIRRHVAKSKRRASLIFINNNNHFHLIDEEQLKTHMTKVKEVDMMRLTHPTVTNSRRLYIDESDETQLMKLVRGEIDPKIRVIMTNADLIEISNEVVRTKNLLPLAIREENSKVTHYLHPQTHQIVVEYQNYEQAKRMFQKALKAFPEFKHDFRFTGQTVANLGKSLFKVINGGMRLDNSAYSEEDLEITNTHHTGPINWCERAVFFDEDIQAIDIKGCYRNCARNMEYRYNVFSIEDYWAKFVPGETKVKEGEYILKHTVRTPYGVPLHPDNLLTYNIVDWLLKRNYIQLTDIAYFRHASFCYRADLFTKFINKVEQMFEEKEAKQIANLFLGTLGKRYNKTSKGFVTTNWEYIEAQFAEHLNDPSITVTDFENKKSGLHFCQVKKETPLRENLASLYRQIINQGKVEVFKLMNRIKKRYPGVQFVYIKTDCVGFKCATKVDPDSLCDIPGTYREDQWKFPVVKKEIDQEVDELNILEVGWKHKLPDFNYKDGQYYIGGEKVSADVGKKYYQELVDKSMCIHGGPGTSKTTLARMFDKEKETYKATFTNKASANLDKDMDELGHRTKTFASTFDNQHRNNNARTFKQYDQFIWDECFNTREAYLRKMYWLKLNRPDLLIKAFGDPNQCPQVNSRFNKHYEYLDSPIFQFICDYTIMEKMYIEGVSRSDKHIQHMLNYLKKHRRLDPAYMDLFKKMNYTLNRSVTKTNKMVRFYNELKVDGQESRLGLMVVANKNFHKAGVYNAERYYVTEEEMKNKHKYYRLMNHEGLFPAYNFTDGFASTVYREQGSTISEPGNILEVENMSFNEIYTALSRFQHFHDIHLNWTDKEFKKHSDVGKCVQIEPIQLTLAEVYELHNTKNNMYYIGETFRTTGERFIDHLLTDDDVINKYDGEWSPSLLTKVYVKGSPDNDSDLALLKEEILEIETHYINYYKHVLELPVANTKQVKPGSNNYNNPTMKSYKLVDYVDKEYKVYNKASTKKWVVKHKSKDVVQIKYGGRLTEEEARKKMEERRQKLIIESLKI